MKTAIITGASSGLGEKFFASVVKQHPDLDEIWLIARRKDRLLKLAETCENVKVRAVALDLNDMSSFDSLSAMLNETSADVRVLINNAGCGVLGELADESVEAQTRMVDLNVRALTAMTVTVLPHMSRGSYIINVSSIASFVPNARMTVYSSTKAYVTSFSRALRFELKKKGINCLAVCPGPMATEFLGIAGINGNSRAFETLPYCDPTTVADKSVKRAAAGKGMYTNKLFYKFYRVLAKILPHSILMYAAKT